MKTWLLLLSFWTLASGAVLAAEADEVAAVRSADEQRIAATLAGDTAKLAPLLSDDLHYGHADGRVQTKAQYLEAVGRAAKKNLLFVPGELNVRIIAPGAVAMSGRAQVVVAANGQRTSTALRFLAVWREEGGRWRLLAYQSTPLSESPAR